MLRISNNRDEPTAICRENASPVGQRLHAWLELDECTEFRDPSHPPLVDVPHLILRLDRRPGIIGELLQTQRNLLLVVVDPENVHCDLFAGFDDLRRVRHARPVHLRDVQQPLNAAAEIDERTEIAD